MNRLLFSSVTLFTCLIILTTGCKKDNPGDDQDLGKLKVSPAIEVSSTSIGTTGGTIKVSKPGTPVDGLEIVIPDSSYPSDRTFKISYAEIKSHQLGEYFNPITPLIIIDNGGDYSKNPMQVTVPINLPDGYFAMAFFYDEISGKLEGIPLLSLSSNSITISTRHFIAGSELEVAEAALKMGSVFQSSSAKMVISSISESVLKSQTIINSGFTPGTDDWEFINYGSYLSPKGHCAGQSITALWYYYEKKLKGEPSLFHQFDQLNDKIKPSFMWVDNSLGYRFASTIQEDFNFSGWVESLAMQKFIPELVFKAFAAAILVTGEPQFVLINNSAKLGGHAMIVYKVNFNEMKLYISDPNYPNNRESGGVESVRIIEYVGGKLKPYETGLNAGGNSISMDQIGYVGKTAYIPWDQISKRFLEVMNGTIGSNPPNSFPFSLIWVKGKVNTILTEGFSTDSDTLRCMVEVPGAELPANYLVNGKILIPFDMYDKDGKQIDIWNRPSASAYVLLKPGLNKIGFYLYARKNDIVDNTGARIPLFIDFKWFNIYYTKLEISPSPITGKPDTEIEITARSFGTAPKDARYVWDFGDGTAEVAVVKDVTVKHKFPKAGEYTVSVSLYNQTTGILVATATAKAIIEPTGCDGVLSFTDTRDNHVYKYKKIGTQTWMIENLAYLPAIDTAVKGSDKSPLYYVYGYLGSKVQKALATENYATYGVLYNHPAAMTACPPGWHLPTDAEWTALTNHLGGEVSVAGKMREAGTAHWLSPNTGATNESCFTALPGGARELGQEVFLGRGSTAGFWSASLETNPSYAWRRLLSNSYDRVTRGYDYRNYGFSVRCLKE